MGYVRVVLNGCFSKVKVFGAKKFILSNLFLSKDGFVTFYNVLRVNLQSEPCVPKITSQGGIGIEKTIWSFQTLF